MLPFVLPPEFLGLSRLEPILRTDLKRPHCTYSETPQNLQRKSKIFSNQFIEDIPDVDRARRDHKRASEWCACTARRRVGQSAIVRRAQWRWNSELPRVGSWKDFRRSDGESRGSQSRWRVAAHCSCWRKSTRFWRGDSGRKR